MIHITPDRVQLRDTALSHSDFEVYNSGAADCAVSIDPEFAYADGITVAAGERVLVHVPEGNRLFGICRAEDETDVVLTAAEIAQRFAHLREDAENTAIWVSGAGWGVVASETEGDWDHTWSGHFGDGTIFSIVATPEANALYVGVEGEGDQRLIIHGEGSFHWGDVGSLTADISGNAEFAFAGLDLSAVGASVTAHPEDYSTFASLLPDGKLDIGAAAGRAKMAPVAANVFGIEGNGGGVQLKSPNGTAYNVTVTNAGAVIATAA